MKKRLNAIHFVKEKVSKLKHFIEHIIAYFKKPEERLDMHSTHDWEVNIDTMGRAPGSGSTNVRYLETPSIIHEEKLPTLTTTQGKPYSNFSRRYVGSYIILEARDPDAALIDRDPELRQQEYRVGRVVRPTRSLTHVNDFLNGYPNQGIGSSFVIAETPENRRSADGIIEYIVGANGKPKKVYFPYDGIEFIKVPYQGDIALQHMIPLFESAYANICVYRCLNVQSYPEAGYAITIEDRRQVIQGYVSPDIDSPEFIKERFKGSLESLRRKYEIDDSKDYQEKIEELTTAFQPKKEPTREEWLNDDNADPTSTFDQYKEEIKRVVREKDKQGLYSEFQKKYSGPVNFPSIPVEVPRWSINGRRTAHGLEAVRNYWENLTPEKKSAIRYRNSQGYHIVINKNGAIEYPNGKTVKLKDLLQNKRSV